MRYFFLWCSLLFLSSCASTPRPESRKFCRDPIARDQALREVAAARWKQERVIDRLQRRLEFVRTTELAARQEQMEILQIELRSQEVERAEIEKNQRRIDLEIAACGDVSPQNTVE